MQAKQLQKNLTFYISHFIPHTSYLNKMNKDTLLNLIKNPASISNDEAEMLEEIVRQNPYFQVGHLLIAKFQHTQKSTLATQKIRKASLYSYNRSRLKTFLDVVSSTENDNPQTFKTTSKDAKVFFEKQFALLTGIIAFILWKILKRKK